VRAVVSGYDAFLSYSHKHDEVLGRSLHSALRRFAKPWYRIQALRIFRDAESLPASPGLWSSIEKALGESRWFILLASEQAAGSYWVNREVQWWLDYHSADRLIVVGTSPGLAWDEDLGDWAAAAPVPPALRGAFGSEPHWVDLSDIPPGSGAARIPADRVATITAPIRGIPKDLLIGEHLCQHRRTMRLAGAAIAFLTALAVGLASVAVLAVRARDTAAQQRNTAVAGQLAVESEALDTTDPPAAASLAAAAWKIDPTEQARDSLLDILAQPFRGTITASSGDITDMAFSPDGKLLVTATDTGVAQVWDAATLREIGAPLQLGNALANGRVSFGPGDTAFAVTGGNSDRIWNITTRRPVGSSFLFPGGIADQPLLSPDFKVMAGGSADPWDAQPLVIIDSSTHREIDPRLPPGQPLSFSADGELLAVSLAPHGRIGVLNIATGHMIGAPMPAGTAAAFSPDGKEIAISGPDDVDVWDIKDHRIAGPPIAESGAAVAFSPDGKMLATVSADGTTDLWDAGSHQQLSGPLTADATGIDTGPAFSPDSKTLATVIDSTVSFWDANIWRQAGAVISIAGGGNGPIAFSPDGKLIAAPVIYGAAIWSVTGRRQQGATIVVNPHHTVQDTDGAFDVAFSPNGKILATGGATNVAVQLWNASSHRKTSALRGPWGATSLTYSLNGNLIAASTSNGITQMWNVRTGRVVGSPMINDPRYELNAIVFSPSGTVLATAGQQVMLFSVSTHREIGVPFATAAGQVSDIAFSPADAIIATANGTGATLWNAATQQQIGEPLDFGTGPAVAVAFNPSGTILATETPDDTIRLWDVQSREQIGPALTATGQTLGGPIDASPTSGIAFSPAGTLLAASTSFGIQVWNVAVAAENLDDICSIAGGPMTRQTWNFYAASEPYQQTCP